MGKSVDQGTNDDAIAVDSQGQKVFVAGAGHKTNRDFLVRAYQARKGSLVWEDRLDEENDGSLANAIAVADGRVFVGGIHQNPNTTLGIPPLILRTYRAANGALLWEAKIDNGISDSNYLAATKGRVFVVGIIQPEDNPTDFHYFVRAYNSKTGALHWGDQDDTSVGFLHALAVDHQQRLFAAGFVLNTSGDADAMIRVYDARPQRRVRVASKNLDPFASSLLLEN